jgi:hypothetical protein
MGSGSRRLLNQSTYKPVGDARIAARPPEGGYFQILHVAPLPLAVDQFGFVKTVYRLGEGLVVAVTNAADRWFDASFGQSPCVSTIALCIEWTDIARPAARQWFAKQTMRGAIRVRKWFPIMGQLIAPSNSFIFHYLYLFLGPRISSTSKQKQAGRCLAMSKAAN